MTTKIIVLFFIKVFEKMHYKNDYKCLFFMLADDCNSK